MTKRRYIEPVQGLPWREVVRECAYDTQQIPDGGINSLTFFTQPRAGYLFSNCTGQGQFNKPQEFYALGIAIEIFPGLDTAIADGITDTWASFKKKIWESAYIEFWVGTKNYSNTLLKRVPQGLGPAGLGVGSVAANPYNTIIVTNGLQEINHYWETAVRNVGDRKKKPIHIMHQQGFYVRITWPTAGQADPGFGTGFEAEVRVYLVGYRWREVM